MELSMEDRVKKLHKENLVIDSHLDLGGIIYEYRKRGEKEILNNYFLDDFKAASVNLIVAAIFVENEFLPDMALKMALRQIEAIYEDISECDSNFYIVKTKEDLERLKENEKIGILMSLEGAEPIGTDLSLLSTFYRLGVRGLGLTWSRRNFVGDGSYFRDPEEGIRGGLTPFGIKAVRKAESVGFFLDVSHLNDEGFQDLSRYSAKPFIASHSNARELNKIRRNLTDEQIEKIAEIGGVIGINAYIDIVSSDPESQNVEKMCDHIEHLLRVGGENNVGFGFDFCNKYYSDGSKHDVIDGHSKIYMITEELLKRGLDENVIIKIMGKNFYEFLMQML